MAYSPFERGFELVSGNFSQLTACKPNKMLNQLYNFSGEFRKDSNIFQETIEIPKETVLKQNDIHKNYFWKIKLNNSIV